MNTLVILSSFLLPAPAAETSEPPPAPTTEQTLTLETVMSDPAWIGAAPERPRGIDAGAHQGHVVPEEMDAPAGPALAAGRTGSLGNGAN